MDPSDWEQIVDKMLEMMKADSTLKKEIKEWDFGDRTVDRIVRFPAVLVYLQRGSVVPGMASETEELDYAVVVVQNRPTDEKKAEREAYRYAKLVREVFKADPSLGGLVKACYRTRVETDRVRFRPREGSPVSVVACVITYHTRHKVT